MLGVSLSYSYKLVRRLDAELEADGFKLMENFQVQILQLICY